MSLLERLKSKGPKRILSLDGGGIRGALTLGYLERFVASAVKTGLRIFAKRVDTGSTWSLINHPEGKY